MVLPVLVAILAAPALLGTQEAIRQSQAKEKREEHRARRCNLIASCVKSSMRSREINGRPIVLRDGKLWIDTGTSDGEPYGHPYAGYYLPYPEEKYEGLVTTITDVAPIMNWVYVDKDTYEVKYGVRLDAQPNITGPFDCTRQDRRLTFDGWEGWCAVEEYPSLWALYFDKDDDGLRSKLAPGTRVLEVELARKEKRWAKEADARQQDQTTKRAVDANEDAPTEEQTTAEPELNLPGVPSEEEPPEPLPLPKSIFSDPPRPIFFTPPAPQPPKTPPPAYSTAVPPAPLAPSRTTPIEQSRSISPQAPASSQSISPSEKRTTPKLNRNSGTRALAQAQMFEAMALGQKPNNDISVRNSRPPSRPASDATSVSDYSNPPQTGVSDIFNMYMDEPNSAFIPEEPSPPPISELDVGQRQQAPTSADPAVFGAYAASAPKASNGRTNEVAPLRRKASSRGGPNNDGPRAPLPPLPGSNGNARRQSPDMSTSGSTGPDRRGVKPTGRDRVNSPDNRRPTASKDMPRSAPRGTARAPGARDSPPPRARNGSASSQQSQNEDGSRPRPLARTKSMATTMTSGARNRGMAMRISSEENSPRLERSRTNSNLYREIDDMVNTGGNRNRSAAGSASRRGDARGDDRPPPLRRAATSRGGLRDTETSRSGNERGFVRRANRDSGERRF